MHLNELGQVDFRLVAASHLNDTEHGRAVDLREVVNYYVDAVTDDADTLRFQRLGALLDLTLGLNVLSGRNVLFLE